MSGGLLKRDDKGVLSVGDQALADRIYNDAFGLGGEISRAKNKANALADPRKYYDDKIKSLETIDRNARGVFQRELLTAYELVQNEREAIQLASRAAGDEKARLLEIHNLQFPDGLGDKRVAARAKKLSSAAQY